MLNKNEIIIKVLNALKENGLNNLSLRSIADNIGISARMLIYHFESYEQLIAQIFIHLSSLHKQRLNEILINHKEKQIEQVFSSFTKEIFSSEYRNTLLLFIELYTTALRDTLHYESFFEEVLINWIDEVSSLLKKFGFSSPDLFASMIVSFYRGLMLDWLASNDIERITVVSDLFINNIIKKGVSNETIQNFTDDNQY